MNDHVVINLKTLGNDIRKLKRIINIYEKHYKSSNIIIYDTDLNYIKKEISVFLRNLKKEINKTILQNSIDIFEREYLGISKYIYAELTFSQDYLKIASLRLLGRKNRKTKIVPRFIAFNLDNPFDPSILSIIAKIKKLVKIDLKKIKKNPDFLKFIKNNVKPIPVFKNVKNTKKLTPDLLKNLSNKFDANPLKDLNDLRLENQKFDDPNFKLQIYDSNLDGILSLDSVSRLISDAENIIEKIENTLDYNPADALTEIYSELLTKYNLGKIIVDLSMSLIKNIDPFEYLKSLSIEELFKLIDDMPDDIKEKIYKFITSKIDIKSLLALIDAQLTNTIEPCNFVSLKDVDLDLDISDIFKYLRFKYPDFKFPEIQPIIDKEFKKFIDIDEFLNMIKLNLNIDLSFLAFKIPEFKLPEINIPNLNILDLFGDISASLDEAILNGISFSLGKISINMLEAALNFPMNDIDIDNIMASVPNIELPNAEFPNIGNIRYPNANVNFDIKKLFKDIKFGNLPNFEILFGDRWAEFLLLLQDIIIESEKFTFESIDIGKFQPDTLKIVESIGGIDQIKKEQQLENKKCEDLKVELPGFSDQVLDLDEISSNFTNPKQKDIKEQLLNQIRNYQYSNIHTYLISKKPNKKIIAILRALAESDLKEKTTKAIPKDKKQLAGTITKMMETLSALLTPTELLNLFAGEYTQKTANIVRNVARLNYPEITGIIDPVKLYIALGKVTGLNNFKQEMDKFRKLGGMK